MPVYRDGQRQSEVSSSQINVSQNIDVDAIAQAVAKAIGKMSNINRAGTGEEFADTFNYENSMTQLADAMIVQRGSKESNFEDLGNTKETKKDKADVDKTIDLLKGLD